jgi:pimeloyl-ACP methyl ester carboxylesterase
VSTAATDAAVAWTTEDVEVAGSRIRLRRAGAGDPVLVLHRDTGSPERLPFYDALAGHFTVYLPAHPGYDGCERPGWMRSVRDLAVVYQGLLAKRELTAVALVGLGFGGWIAAEMASMSPLMFRRLVLVGAMGIKPRQGEILDQAILSYIDYVRAGFEDKTAFERIYGAEPATSQLELWDLNREMTFRIAWKPYMYNPSLPHLLGSVRAPSLVVWGSRDRVVPRDCGEQYARALGRGRLATVEGAGHFVEMEQPDALAELVTRFAADSDAGSGAGPR